MNKLFHPNDNECKSIRRNNIKSHICNTWNLKEKVAEFEKCT